MACGKKLWKLAKCISHILQKPKQPNQKKTGQDSREEQKDILMYKYSQRSLDKLKTCHPDIQKVFMEVIKHVDVTILEGVRTKETQEEYVRTGKSKTMNSKHLKQSDGYSHAIDAIAYPIEWDNWQRNYMVAGFIKGVAASMGVKLRMGADWDGDFTTKDQTFHDLPHFELDNK